MDINNFKQFKNTGTKLSNHTFSINKSRSFGINSGFYHKNNIKIYKYAVLFYNDKDRSIAFLFTNDENINGKFKITHSDNKTSGNITAVSFFNSYGLNIKEIVGKYNPKEIVHPEFGKIFYVTINKTVDNQNKVE